MISLKGLFSADAQTDRAVPPSGFTAWLTVFAAAAMSFLAIFALALSISAARLADRWGEELARSATIRISAPPEQRAAQTEAALEILRQTPGVAEARALSEDEQAALLAPWFGADLPTDSLPVPQLIAVTETAEGIDAAGLRLRLQGEVPGAVLDDHGRWRRPLVEAADRLRLLGWVSMALITATVAAIVTLAAQAALAANAQVIEVLRLVGAKDGYIAGAFIRRFTLRALTGSAAGMMLGAILLMLLPGGKSQTGSFLTGLGFRGAGWLLPLLIPPLVALVAFVATGAAARRALRETA